MQHALKWLIVCAVVVTAQLSPAASVNDFAVYNRVDSSNNILLPGRLHIPADFAANPNVERPLIMFLHGSGASGTDNVAQLNSVIDNLLYTAKDRGAFLYAPQTDAGWSDSTILTWAMEMIDLAIAESHVDARRIYVTGYSMGGGGAWSFLNLFHDRVAATVPLAGVPPALEFDPAKLINEPIWAIHGRRDTNVPVEVTRDVIASLLTEAGLAEPTYIPALTQGPLRQYDFSPLALHYTEMSGGHNIPPAVYHPTLPPIQPAMYDWMFSQVQVPEPLAFVQASGAVIFLLRVRSSGRRV
jgi:predicted peptidase